ncbi:uncharacterized protein LOC132273191 [Cornus florida]|uniref:uncharacterized protein LOC132273191 n=1 Tax=Cornus florida TaxID=4283 RepID=UPI00289A01EC|nr:uncharacterized protein LOC132273191 [Cornus florida]
MDGLELEQLLLDAPQLGSSAILSKRTRDPIMLLFQLRIIARVDDDNLVELYDAAVEGSIPSLHELFGEDPEVLDKVIEISCSDETTLHVAVLRGHVDFVKEILERKPELAGEFDSQLSSPLHLASANGHLEIVKALLLAKPEMRGFLVQDGRNRLHLAAINGRFNVLNELVQTSPNAARAPLDHGKTNIMHLCVQHNQLETLKLLVQKMNDEEFANSKDEYGNTILHQAVADKQIEMVKYLLSSTRIEVHEVNVNRLTALDILAQSRRDVKDLDIGESLRQAGVLRAKVLLGVHAQSTPLMNDLQHSGGTNTTREWLAEKRNLIMLVVSLIATMTLQTAINPPGGVWQDDSTENFQGSPVPNPHKAGDAVMAYNHPGPYAYFYIANLMGFCTSLTTIFMLITESAFKNQATFWALIGIMCLTIVPVMVAIAVSISAITPDKLEEKIVHKAGKVCLIMGSCILMIILILAFVAIRRLRRVSSSVDVRHGKGDQEAPQI